MNTQSQAPDASVAVSVLVPIYNVERYLRQCLQSIAVQTLDNIEIICINDGSTDDSRAIIEEFLQQDGRFRVIDKANSGYGASMNQGLDAARGDFIAIVESDDFIEPDALEVMYEAACAYGVDVVKCDFYLYWSVPDERSWRFGFTSKKRSGLINPLEMRDVFYLKPSIWSAIYRRSFLEDNDIRFLETPGASYQDASFNFKVWACAQRAYLIDRAFLYYRQDNETSSVNAPGKVYCVCDEYDEMLRFLTDRPELARELLSVLVKMRYDSYMWNYDRLNDDLKESWALRMALDFRAEDEADIVDYDLFELWKAVDRRVLMKNPQLFHERRQKRAQNGRLGAIRYYYEMGGLPLASYMILLKLRVIPSGSA